MRDIEIMTALAAAMSALDTSRKGFRDLTKGSDKDKRKERKKERQNKKKSRNRK